MSRKNTFSQRESRRHSGQYRNRKRTSGTSKREFVDSQNDENDPNDQNDEFYDLKTIHPKESETQNKYNKRYISGQRANALKQCRYGGRYVPLEIIKQKISQWYAQYISNSDYVGHESKTKMRLASIQIPEPSQSEFWSFIIETLPVELQQQFTSSGREAMPTNKTKPRKRSPKRKSIIDSDTSTSENLPRDNGQMGQSGRSGADGQDNKNIPPLQQLQPMQLQQPQPVQPVQPVQQPLVAFPPQSLPMPPPTQPPLQQQQYFYPRVSPPIQLPVPGASAGFSAIQGAAAAQHQADERARAFAAGVAAANAIHAQNAKLQRSPSVSSQPLPPPLQQRNVSEVDRIRIQNELSRLNYVSSSQANSGRIPPVFQQLEVGPEGGMYYRLPNDPTKVKYYTKAQKEQFLNGQKNPMCVGNGCDAVYNERRKHQFAQQGNIMANSWAQAAQSAQQQADIQRYQNILLEQQNSSAAAAAAARPSQIQSVLPQQPPPLSRPPPYQPPIAFQRRPNMLSLN